MDPINTRIAILKGDYQTTVGAQEFMELTTAILVECAEKIMGNLSVIPHDKGRAIAAMDALIAVKDVFKVAVDLPHVNVKK